ncbi:MAG: OmpH family outer membrane protein [Candidatus Velthaea sp.]|jgi:outer membrane protein
MTHRFVSAGRAFALVAAAAAFLAAPAALAADVTDIGFVDQGVLAALPSFQTANRQFADFGRKLQSQYVARAHHANAAGQAQLAQEFQSRMAEEQQRLVGPLLSKAQVAIASVASSKNLSVIVDKRIVVFGGTDITGSVRDLLTSPGDPVPPASTPGPSSVGYVDQRAIDDLAKVKAVQADFAKFKADEEKAAQAKLKAAKTDTERQAIFTDYKKSLDAKSDQLIKPVVDQTRGVIGDVAKKKGLTLVIDRGNIIYGGQDITSDVTAALK